MHFAKVASDSGITRLHEVIAWIYADEHWTEADKDERIEELMKEKGVLEALFEQLQNGYVPAFEYEFYPMEGCQLFGCQQHENDEYRNSNKTEESTI